MSAVADFRISGHLYLADSMALQNMNRICEEFHVPLTDHQILINVETQRLHLIHLGQFVHSYVISTALNGVGQQENTGKTPLGLHVIGEKIGEGADPFEIFKSRVSTGEIAKSEEGGTSIVGRILRLQGAQPGFNQGYDEEKNVVDSHDRYIYIHGTNDVPRLGQPVSGGCVRMNPSDVIDLFNQVPEKTPVYIYTDFV